MKRQLNLVSLFASIAILLIAANSARAQFSYSFESFEGDLTAASADWFPNTTGGVAVQGQSTAFGVTDGATSYESDIPGLDDPGMHNNYANIGFVGFNKSPNFHADWAAMAARGVIAVDVTVPTGELGPVTASVAINGSLTGYLQGPYLTMPVGQTTTYAWNIQQTVLATFGVTIPTPMADSDYGQMIFADQNFNASTVKVYMDNVRFLLWGDFNQDGHVNAADISAMELALAKPNVYDATYNSNAGILNGIGDFNNDGVMNNADLQGFLNYLKNGSGSLTGVPEPASLALLGLAVPAFVAVARRRKA